MPRHLSAFALLLSATAPAHDHQAAPQPQAAPAPAPDPAAANARLHAPLPADQAAMKAHVMFLASDAMRGREAGSPEYDIAAQYVAAQFYAAGLKPGGDGGGFLQRVPLVAYAAADKGVLTRTVPGAAPQRMEFGVDYIPLPNGSAARWARSTPIAFVGYGVDAPQYRHDDYRDVDVRGKVVLFVGGAPAAFEGEERAFFGAAQTKLLTAAAKGAIGAIQILPRLAAPEMARSAARYAEPRMTWTRADGTAAVQGVPLLATVGAAGAAKLFAGARTPWAQVAAQAATATPRFRPEALPGTLAVEARTAFTPVRSSNVVGLIPGSDPRLRHEVVVLSAHLDHIGVNPKGEGDRINNGAMDNAMGIASLIEEARRFKTAAKAPRRTVMFLAVTAEEKGLVGADYFANNPTVPIGGIVADVNLDMPILTFRFEDLIVFGADRSTLGPIVRRAAAAEGVSVSPDPIPEQGIFVRSDHFRFVQRGVPSVFLWPGQKGPGKAAYDEFFARHYHKPSDEPTLPIDWSQGPRFVALNYAIAREIADADQRPVWNRGDYFGTLYKGPMAK